MKDLEGDKLGEPIEIENFVNPSNQSTIDTIEFIDNRSVWQRIAEVFRPRKEWFIVVGHNEECTYSNECGLEIKVERKE